MSLALRLFSGIKRCSTVMNEICEINFIQLSEKKQPTNGSTGTQLRHYVFCSQLLTSEVKALVTLRLLRFLLLFCGVLNR